VPAGVDEGDQIRLGGEGEAGEHGGPPGDLYVLIKLKPHALFKREQDDLYCEVPVSFVTAALGGDVEIPTLDGRANIKVPPETQTDKVFRLRGKGVKNVRSGQIGDLYCKISVETPVKLTKRQRELLEEFEVTVRDGGSRHSPREQSWVDKVKQFFG
jgi:molecular chaperone DnaJ